MKFFATILILMALSINLTFCQKVYFDDEQGIIRVPYKLKIFNNFDKYFASSNNYDRLNEQNYEKVFKSHPSFLQVTPQKRPVWGPDQWGKYIY